jgi:hypothetical protein
MIIKKQVKSFCEVLLFYLAAYPAVRYTSLAGRHGYRPPENLISTSKNF